MHPLHLLFHPLLPTMDYTVDYRGQRDPPHRTRTYLGLGDVVSGGLDHGKVALADGLFDFVVSNSKQLIHGRRGCGAPELLLLLLLLGTPATRDQRIVFGHRVFQRRVVVFVDKCVLIDGVP